MAGNLKFAPENSLSIGLLRRFDITQDGEIRTFLIL